MKHLFFLLAAASFSLLATNLVAADNVCDTRGEEDCFAYQMITLESTPSVQRQLAANPGRSGSTGLRLFESGAETAGGVCMYLYIWLQPQSRQMAENGQWRLPIENIREIRYDQRGNPTFVQPTPITGRQQVPEVHDARISQWSQPSYVLQGRGGEAGVGWTMPAHILDDIWFAMMCPCADVQTTFPNRITAREGMILYPEDIENAIRQDREYTFQAMAVVQ